MALRATSATARAAITPPTSRSTISMRARVMGDTSRTGRIGMWKGRARGLAAGAPLGRVRRGAEPRHHCDAGEGHGRYLTYRTNRNVEGAGEGTRGGPPLSAVPRRPKPEAL